MYFGVARLAAASLRTHGYRLVDAHPPHALLDVAGDDIVCGDAHAVLLLFQRGGAGDGATSATPSGRHTLALLVTATYKTGEHDLSRPVLESMGWRLAPGPRPRRLARLVLERGLSRVGGALDFGDAAVVGGDVVTTEVVEKTHAGWTVAVVVDPSSRVPDGPPHPADGAGSDSDDDMERISLDAMAAMVKNTNRDFRERQTWARQQKRRRAGLVVGRGPWRRGLMVGILGLVGAVVVRRWGGPAWLWIDGARWHGLYPFYVLLGGIVVASFGLVVWPAAAVAWRR